MLDAALDLRPGGDLCRLAAAVVQPALNDGLRPEHQLTPRNIEIAVDAAVDLRAGGRDRRVATDAPVDRDVASGQGRTAFDGGGRPDAHHAPGDARAVADRAIQLDGGRCSEVSLTIRSQHSALSTPLLSQWLANCCVAMASSSVICWHVSLWFSPGATCWCSIAGWNCKARSVVGGL